MGRGVVHLVGAGPGDVGLITVAGRALLRQADVVIHDRLIDRRLLRYVQPGAVIINAGKSPGRHTLTQDEINSLLVDHAACGARVVRLKGGDPFVFGRGLEELEACRAAGIACHVVPGVSSAVAAAAAIGVPVTARHIARAFVVVTAQVDPDHPGPTLDFAALAKIDTVVVLMGCDALREVAASMMQAGRRPETPVACVQEATMADQRHVVGTLADIADIVAAAGLRAPVVTIIGEVARYALPMPGAADSRPGLPLAGRRVVLTRPASASRRSREWFTALGATVIDCPLIRIRPTADPAPLRRAMGSLPSYKWLLLSSVHGVRAFAGELAAMHRDARALAGVSIACVGPATADALQRAGLRADLVPTTYSAASLAAAMAAAGDLHGARVLYPRSAIAAPHLADALRAAGAVVDDVAAYETVAAEPPAAAVAAIREGVDAILFFSPSAVGQFVSLDLRPGRAIIGCIGPTTAAAARAAGLPVAVAAERHTADGLADAVSEALRRG
jgi:uroporphyrinogen III methyltransferase/synthase